MKNNPKEKTENLIKLFLLNAGDIKTVLTKLEERRHKMQALNTLSEKERQKIARETLEIYAPIANRLGIGGLKGQLEDSAFKELYPEEYQKLKNEVAKKFEAQEKYIKKIKPILYEILEKENIIPLEINLRAKHLYSLYQKLLRYKMNFDEIYDLVAARIIVKNVNDCYLALGAIHQIWKPLLGHIKDYIAMPKSNGYQSLHTTVYGPEEKIFEIQIRTPKMHIFAESGIASHWAYKEKKTINEETSWVAQLKNQKQVAREIFKDRIFALTPHGDVINMPEGATPIDFAYQIHTNIGNECSGAKINGKIAALNTKLQSGDMVEILIQKGKKPSIDWLSFVRTDIAKDKIKNALREKNKILKSR